MTTHTETWQGGEHTPIAGQRAVPGTVVGGRYLLRAAIGTGGMGTVWQASDTVLRRDVAVKEVAQPQGIAPSDLAAMYERTLREARAAAALSHPSVVQVYDVVTEGGRPWIIMELLQARSLADMIISDGALAARVVAKIGVAMLGALEVAHSAGVLHRDVKPANVLICADGRCVLTDFGVARLPTDTQLTTPGMVLGSPHFISPERAVGGKFGPPSDLFSLGVTLYTAVEGRPPFDKGDPFETMRAVVEEEPAPYHRSGPLAPVLSGLLIKDPTRRWEVHRARTMLRDLLDGPLSTAALTAAHNDPTDPYAVVQPAAAPYRPPQQRRVGGRALIDPGPTDPAATATGEYEMPAEDVWAAPSVRVRRRAEYQRHQPSRSHRTAHHGGLIGDIADGAKHGAMGLWRRIEALPKLVRYGLIAAVAVAVALAIAVPLGLFDGDGLATAPITQRSSSPSPEPPLAMAQVTERGITVDVPKDWKLSRSGTYTDFTDPTDGISRIRILAEPAKDAKALVTSADRRYTTVKTVCAEYERIGDFIPIKMGGLDGYQLEYRCTTPNNPLRRHGVLRTVVVNGTAFEINLSATDDRYVACLAVFDWATGTFKVTA